ncbi:MAG: type I secretion system permease/ATPase, partial [Rhizobiales bacterium]|nr:type I secretion system permease/ATPase [Hyphomicrobiales bacterium]
MQNENIQTEDAGLLALWLFLRLQGVHAALDQIRERCGTTTIDIRTMLRCAGQFGVTVGSRTTHWKHLAGMRLPGIAALRDGGFLLLGRVDDSGALVLYPNSPQPKLITRAEFEAIWDGRVVSSGPTGLMQHARNAVDHVYAEGRKLTKRARYFFESRVGRYNELLRTHRAALDIFTHTRELMRRFYQDERGEIATPSTEAETANTDDSGLLALVTLLRCHGIAADPEQIRHRLGIPRPGVADMLRCAKDFGLKARLQKSGWDRLAVTPLPGIAVLRDGRFLILGKMLDETLLVQWPLVPQPEIMTRAELEDIWDGEIVLMARRASLTDLSRRFDITWFLGAIHKYRRLLGEVLVASFFLQLFGVISPLFFQVVIDKVLVHQSMSTLDVLIIGLVSLTIFEAILGALRVYVFAHTTNRIDVELGARLFRHLMALP